MPDSDDHSAIVVLAAAKYRRTTECRTSEYAFSDGPALPLTSVWTAREARLTWSKAAEDEVRSQCVTARTSYDTGMNAQDPTLRNVTRTRFRRG